MLLKNMSKHSQHDRHLVASNKLIVSEIATNVFTAHTETVFETKLVKEKENEKK